LADDDLQRAASAWNLPDESLESVVRRIHDGVADDRLEARADGYVASMFAQFGSVPIEPTRTALEIGSGVGYIMEAIERFATARGNADLRIDGLDIAEHMIAKAKQRLGQRGDRFGFVHYDGLRIPAADGSYDLVYSVAALQHVPKAYVYNLFFEIRRVLSGSGHAILNFLGYRGLPRHARWSTWRKEVDLQLGRGRGPHHYFYSVEELDCILRETGFARVDVRDGEQLWACVAGR
jgi:ubiquinone/menaquinone biosynthesis C-methylase UbiE